MNAMLDGLFITSLFTWPLFFVCVVFTVIVSICVHELAHGIAAVRLGDRTPILTGHMTLDPLVHMGPYSLLVLAITGIAWGQMPIDPTRLRGKYAESIVALAGPISNLVMALIVLVAVGVWFRAEQGSVSPAAAQVQGLDDAPISRGPDLPAMRAWVAPALGQEDPEAGPFQQNLRFFLFIFGSTNLALFLFNMLPIPPLDGAHVLANLHHGYGRFIHDPNNGTVLMMLFIFAFTVGSRAFSMSRGWSIQLMAWAAGMG